MDKIRSIAELKLHLGKPDLTLEEMKDYLNDSINYIGFPSKLYGTYEVCIDGYCSPELIELIAEVAYLHRDSLGANP